MNKQSGQVSRALLILAIVILVAAVGVFLYLKYVANGRLAQQRAQEQAQNEPPKPVYETQVGEVKFTFKSARNLGRVLVSPPSSGFSQTVTTTERFIQVVVGAQNKGQVNTVSSTWGVRNLVDSEGRIFTPVDSKAYFLLPKPNLCGTVLRPEFDPVSCMRIYDVSTESKGLKVEVFAQKKDSSKKEIMLLDLDLR